MSRALNFLHKIRDSNRTKLPVIVKDSLRRAICPLIDKRIVVFIFDRDKYCNIEKIQLADGFAIRRYDRAEDIPASMFDGVEDPAFEPLRASFSKQFDIGGSFYAATFNDRFAACVWTVRAENLDTWHARIGSRDVVNYGGSTLSEYRGLRLHRSLMRAVLEDPDYADDDIYCDAKMWNTVARRNIERAGYRPIAVVRGPEPRVRLR